MFNFGFIMATFIAIGDLHLTDANGMGGLAKYLEEPDAFVLSVVESILKVAYDKGISHIVFLGDICDSPRMSYVAQKLLVDLFRKHAKLIFHVYLGNHDKFGSESSSGHSLELLVEFQLPNVKIYTEVTDVTIDGADVRFLPWPAKNFSKSKLNFAHIEVKGSMLDTGRVMDSDELSGSSAVIIDGHLHTAHKVRNTHYAGTIYQTNFGESVNKYFLIVDYNSNDDWTVEKFPTKPKYTLHNVVLKTEGDVANIPTSKYSLVKLIIQDGVTVKPETLALPNIVVTKAYKSKEELQAIVTEDVSSAEIIIQTQDFFNEWLASLDAPEKKKKELRALRKRILNL